MNDTETNIGAGSLDNVSAIFNKLKSNNKFDEDEIHFMKSYGHIILDEACKINNMVVADYVYEIIYKRNLGYCAETPTITIRSLFTRLCTDNKVDAAKYVYYHNDNKVIIGDVEFEFSDACRSGYAQLAKLLYEISLAEGTKIDIHRQNDNIFKMSCQNGHLELARWLYEVSKTDNNNNNNGKIDIHVFNDFPFRWSCRNGYVEVAKWLYELSKSDDNGLINIHIEDDYVFKWCCDNHNKSFNMVTNYIYSKQNFFLTLSWLCSLTEDYTMISEFGKLKYKIKNVQTDLKDILLDDKFGNTTFNKLLALEKYYENAPTMNKSDKDDVCPICLADDKTKYVKLDCEHLLCVDCYVQYKEDNDKCFYKCVNSSMRHVKILKI